MEIIYNNSENLYTNNGHLIGMLDRDQRTAKYSTIVRHVCYQQRSIIIKNDSIKELIKETTKTIYCYRSNWRYNYVYKTFQSKLKLLLFISLYFIRYGIYNVRFMYIKLLFICILYTNRYPI